MYYEYVETADSRTIPDPAEYGEGWEYWSDRVVKNKNGDVVEHTAVWRRIKQEESSL